MNKYEKFVSDLTSRTESGEASWELADRDEIKGVFRDESFVFRQYRCDWSPKPGTTIFFVEKQVPNYIEDHNITVKEAEYELSVLEDGGKPIFLIDRTYVSFRNLYDLNSVIEQKTREASDFFSEYED
ncbi:hypothetical protein [Halofilum ochraceum]|uniref:hypothetical protein n=1 Tax=Halofilum ochraceum TaxID=1611323 RepID=UPI0011131BE9|nr:hypothetical protein [Halofilum ochraceum]